MESTSRSLFPLANIWLDGTPITFTHAFLERLPYEWMVEVVNPYPLPFVENQEYVASISFEQMDGNTFSSLPIESYHMEEGKEFTVYRLYMYPPEARD